MSKFKTRALEQWWRIKEFSDVVHYVKLMQKIRLRAIRRRGKATVVLFASNLSMWKLDELYTLFANDKRFDTHVVVAPFRTFTEEQKSSDIAAMKEHLDNQGIPYLDDDMAKALFRKGKADIIFYPQPYYGLLEDPFDYHDHKGALMCYIPYAIFTANNWWAYNLNFHNVAWKLYYPTTMHKDDAFRQATNKGRNVVTVGDIDYFQLYKPTNITDVWRPQDVKKRRIIWAPHHSFADGDMHRDSFTYLANFMLTVAERYADRIQFAFKPHPRLKTVLYAHPNWGPERTEEYYNKWATMPNCQVELGEYVNLFNSSDALIHDCGSFTALYQYTNKPALFVSKNLDGVKRDLNDFGILCIDKHYHAKDESEIIAFIEDVVLRGNNTASDDVNEVVKALTPPNGISAAQNIYNDIVRSLGI